jgi:hypothetical protein
MQYGAGYYTPGIYDLLQFEFITFAKFLPLIYSLELEIIETTDTASSALFLDICL